MRQKIKILTTTVILSICFVSGTAFGQDIDADRWVTGNNVPVYSDINGTGIICYLPSGTRINVRGCSGDYCEFWSYYQSPCSGMGTTYINRYDVTATQPYLSFTPTSYTVGSGSGTTTGFYVDSNHSSLSWSLSNDASWLSLSTTSGTGNGSFNITYDQNNTCTSRTATITVTATNTSATISPTGSIIKNTMTITQQGSSSPSQPGTISGTTPVCANSGSKTYSISSVSGATSYTWTLPSGWSGSSTSTSISATPGSSAQSGTICVRANNSCGSSSESCFNVTVNNVPSQPGTISGATPMCANSGYKTYSISSVSGATSYTWTLPSGWSGSSTSTSISATPGSSAQSGTISVTANNDCGSSTACTYSVTVNTVPSQPGTITGTSPVCANSESKTYSISSVSGATSYTWSYPSGWSGNSTSNSISLTPGTNAQSGTISVIANNDCGSSTERTYSVTVNTVPAQPSTITGSNTVYSDDTGLVYSVTNVSGVTYSWTLPSGWTGNSTTNSITVTVGTTSGTITVTPNNSCGDGTARTLQVTVTDTPIAPTITTTSLPNGTTDTAYNQTLAVTGTTPITWTVSSGNLPAGLDLSPGGTISGTPTTVGTYTFTVKATNSTGDNTKSLSITVTIPQTAPTITITSLPNSTTGTAYNQTLAATGTTPITWTVSSGNLPAGLTLSPSGTISGTPTTAGTFTFTVKVTNSAGNDTKNFTIIIEGSSCNGITPLLTTKWNQSEPYYNDCPLYNGNRSVTGCVATAMTQIMYYWSLSQTEPQTNTQRGYINQRSPSTIPAYITNTLHISVPSVTNTTTFDWSNMKNNTSDYTTTIQKNAVARLMYECGVSVYMDYSPSGSGAYVESDLGPAAALPAYFNYDNHIAVIYRDYYSGNWDNRLREELNAGRPIFYAGFGDSGGHAFVCDGYKCEDNTFHFNWGWGGYYDGYFVTSVLTPTSSTNFSQSQRAIVNIKPNPIGYTYATPDDIQITSNAGTGGFIIPSGNSYVYSGENKPYTFAANTGYEIDQVFIDGTPNEDAKANCYYIFENVTQNHSIIVTFEQETTTHYTILTSAGVGGSISPSSTVIVNGGNSQTFFFYSDEGYEIDQVLIDGNVDETAKADGTYTFQNVAADHTISVTFKFSSYYTISASSNPPAGGSTSGGGAYNEDVECTVTATANDGYSFVSWIENGVVVSSRSSYTFTVQADRDLVANFRLNTLTINYDAGGGSGSKSATTHDYNLPVSMPDNPYTRTEYTFSGWVISGDGSGTWTSGSKTPTDLTNINSINTADRVITLTAQWTIPTIVAADTPNITAQPQPATYTQNAAAIALTVTATINDEGTLSYQWYSNATDSNTGGTTISGATGASYMPPTATAGTTYYYVVVTNTNEKATGAKTITATSNTAEIKVTRPLAITVGGKEATRNGDNFRINVSCDDFENGQISVQVHIDNPLALTLIGGKEQNPFDIELPNHGDNEILINIFTQDAGIQTYTLTINKPLPFEQIVEVRWNNTLTVINNPAINGGYTFSSYKWFCDGEEIGFGQSWSAGPNGEQLNALSVYHVEVVTQSHQILRSCESRVAFKNLDLKAYPNPVSVGQTLYIEAEGLSEGVVVEIYDIYGKLVNYQRNLAPVEVRFAPGVYFVVIRDSEGIKKELKVVVND